MRAGLRCPGPLRRASGRLGYRGWDLLIVSLLWVLIGLRIFTHGDPDPEHVVFLENFGEGVRVAIWWACAGIGFVTAWWPTGKDKWGWSALVIPPSLRALQYLVAWGAGLATGGAYGYTAAWEDAVGWTLTTLFVFRMARRPEMPALPGKEDA